MIKKASQGRVGQAFKSGGKRFKCFRPFAMYPETESEILAVAGP